MKSVYALSFLALTLSFGASGSSADDPQPPPTESTEVESRQDPTETPPQQEETPENAGEEYLHKATRLKINAQSFGDLKEVIRLCGQAVTKGLDEQNLIFAKQLIASTRFERASRICDGIFERYPPSENWPTLAQLALIDLEEAVKHQEVFAESYLLIGRLRLLPGGNHKQARDAFDKVIAQAENDLPVLAMGYALRGETRKKPADQLKDFDAALKIQPELLVALRARGVHYMKANEPGKAVDDFRKAATLEPDDAQIHEMLGLGFLFTDRLDESLKSFGRSIEIDPKRASALAYRARIFLEQEQLDQALEDIDRALGEVVDNLSWRLVRAQIYWQQENYVTALREVEQVLAIDAKYLDAISMRAAILAADEQLDEAIAGLKRALDALPDHNGLLMNLALFFGENGQTAEALETYDTLLQRPIPLAAVYRSRGDLLLNVGKQSEAIEDYGKALQLAPNDSGILNNLAWVLATSPKETLRDGERSLKLAKRACEVTHYKEAHILSTLAAAFAENGDFPEAIRWSTQAVELGNSAVDDQLSAELESYQAGKPWREIQTAAEEQEAENKDSETDQEQIKTNTES